MASLFCHPVKPHVGLSLAVLLLALSLDLHAQDTEAAAAVKLNPYGTGLGAAILLTNSGFGLGGYYQHTLTPSASWWIELSIGAGKDEREVAFFDRFGRKDVPNKANFLLMIPLQLGIQKRLFQDAIEDNFRPYVQVSAGPTLGWEYPYFDDENGNGILDSTEDTFDVIGAIPKGHVRMGLGGTVALGANFGLSRRLTQGVRIGYTFTHFFQGIQLLEPDVQAAQNFFGTPTISVFFGKLF